jgi:hypothetical protein
VRSIAAQTETKTIEDTSTMKLTLKSMTKFVNSWWLQLSLAVSLAL